MVLINDLSKRNLKCNQKLANKARNINQLLGNFEAKIGKSFKRLQVVQ